MKKNEDNFDIIYLDDDDDFEDLYSEDSYLDDDNYNDSLDDDDDYDMIRDLESIKGRPPVRGKKSGARGRTKRKNDSGKRAASLKTAKKAAGKAAGVTGKAVKTTGKAAYRIIGMGFRLITFALISYILYLLLTDFWNGKNVFGDLTLMVYDKNYVLAAYCATALLILFYEFISLIWSFTASKVSEDGHIRKFDTGRGFFSFILIYAGAVISARFASMIPASPEFLRGIEGALTNYGSLSSALLPLCAAGVVCSLLRKFIFH